MPLTPDPPFPKTQGDNIRSKDWNDLVTEAIRLDTAKFDRTGGRLTGPLQVDGPVGIGTTTPNRSLTIQGNPGTFLNVRSLTGGPFEVLLGADSNGGVLSVMTNHDLQIRAGGNTTRMVVKANGNIGIGTLDPGAPLHVASFMSVGPFAATTGAGGIDVTGPLAELGFVRRTLTAWPATAAAGDRFVWYNPDGTARLFTEQRGDLVTVTSIGNLGIGTTSPYAQLTLTGSLGFTNATTPMLFIFQSGTTNPDRPIIAHSPSFSNWGLAYRDSNDTMVFQQDGAPVVTVDLGGSTAFRLDVSGTAHASAFPVSSDARFKTNVAPLTNALAKLEKIHGVSFEWNALYKSLGRATGHREIGVIAQEVEAVFPELVTTWGDEHYRAIDYGRLTVALIEAIKELKAENIALQQRIEALETSIGGGSQA
jgi:hypothetical protein